MKVYILLSACSLIALNVVVKNISYGDGFICIAIFCSCYWIANQINELIDEIKSAKKN